MNTATSSTVEQKRFTRPTTSQARFAFIVLLIINILNYTDRSILASVQTLIQQDFHLTDIELGLLNSSFLFVYGLATLPIGIWADRGTRKNIVALCVGVWSVATALSGLTLNFIQLFLTRSVLGIGEAGYAPASVSLIGDYFPKERRGFMLSVWSIGNLIGTALGLILGGIIAEALGWRWVFYIVGLPGLLAAFLIWRAVEPRRGAFDRDEDNGAEEAGATHGSIGSDIFRVVKQLGKTPTYWVLVAAFICSFFIIGAALSWVPTFLHREFHLTIARAAPFQVASWRGAAWWERSSVAGWQTSCRDAYRRTYDHHDSRLPGRSSPDLDRTLNASVERFYRRLHTGDRLSELLPGSYPGHYSRHYHAQHSLHRSRAGALIGTPAGRCSLAIDRRGHQR
ncbi:spinster family MFS transporter [Dictyobacter kobayashii]|uniref:spinster family MFS transporter n=1 Tax=Dictyobacter kobayashii TaxID=2014872 RepID=UPI000F8251AA|nr:MFS transporter [Dictyobacter kobayashii]